MDKTIKMGFEKQGVTLKLEAILPLKQVKESYKKSDRYQRIKASIAELNLVEPLIVYPQKDMPGSYILLEGHTRLEILKELGIPEVYCLISTDDEGYTYNQQVNRLTAIQEHCMILKTLKSGVSEERVARTLNVNPETIRMKRDLLKGICPEAVELLKKSPIGRGAIMVLKKLHPLRQMEIAELMISSDNFSEAYAQAMFAITPKNQLLEPEKDKKIAGIQAEDIARMEKEMGDMSHNLKELKSNYGHNVLNLVVARGYISKLLDNAKVVRWLAANRVDLLVEFQKLLQITALDAQ